MTRRDIPNLITALRIVLVAPVVYALISGRYGTALALFALAALSDSLDGLLARRYDWRTRLGSLLDPLADKLLLTASFLALGWIGAVAWWLVAAVLARDAVIVAGATAYHLLIGRFDAEPTFCSKVNTVVQVCYVLLVVVALGYDWAGSAAVGAVGWMVLFTVMVSGGDYVWRWGRRARQEGAR